MHIYASLFFGEPHIQKIFAARPQQKKRENKIHFDTTILLHLYQCTFFSFFCGRDAKMSFLVRENSEKFLTHGESRIDFGLCLNSFICFSFSLALSIQSSWSSKFKPNLTASLGGKVSQMNFYRNIFWIYVEKYLIIFELSKNIFRNFSEFLAGKLYRFIHSLFSRPD